ncbi:MAG TPA: hemerythrin domain-containing protein [Gammaproteobacteria bacterium]|nr:hemerythrin domain-containing protein [Gammaproteobacteria bacterium]
MTSTSVLGGLRRDHANMRSVLMLVAHQLDHLENFGVADFVLLANALYYMRKFPSHVHHPKEDLIFQRLAERDSAWKPEVDKLLAQHGEVYALEDELIERALDSPPAGSEAARELLEKGRYYLQLQRRHSEAEERLLFPQAEATLVPKDWAAISSRIRDVEDPLFGQHGSGRYRLLYEHILREAEGN